MSVTVRIGTSGYDYPEWRGLFYPRGLPASRRLSFYGERFDTVEINATFRRMPTEKAVAGWAAAIPVGFVFTLKAPGRITHARRLRDVDEPLRVFCDTARGPATSSARSSSSSRRTSRRRSAASATSSSRSRRTFGARSSSATRPGSPTTCTRRCVRGMPPSASPTRKEATPPTRRPRRGATTACATSSTRGRRWPAGRTRSHGPAGATCSATSSTRRRRAVLRWRRGSARGFGSLTSGAVVR